jgi:branched-chain amino acid transport system substrate-binding protein
MCKNNKRMTKGSLTRRCLLLAGAASGAALFPRNFGLFNPAIAQSNPLRIGVMAPLSGVYASLGTNKVNGIRMLLAEKNNQVEGRPVQLIIEDTEAKPQEGLRKARKLIEQDNADVLLGVMSSGVGYALKDYVARAKRVWVTTGAAADGIFKKANNTPYAYRASLSLWQANDPMGTWAAEKGFKRAFITGPDYAMGREATTAFERAFTAKGATRVGEVFAPLATNDFAPYLAEIKRVNPDVVYATYAGSDAVRFVQQYAAFGLKGAIPLAGFGYLVEEDTIPAQGDTVEGIHSGLNWA